MIWSEFGKEQIISLHSGQPSYICRVMDGAILSWIPAVVWFHHAISVTGVASAVRI